jgi:hypothetical protein
MVPQMAAQEEGAEDPRVIQMRKLVTQMKTESNHLDYDAREDEKILHEALFLQFFPKGIERKGCLIPVVTAAEAGNSYCLFELHGRLNAVQRSTTAELVFVGKEFLLFYFGFTLQEIAQCRRQLHQVQKKLAKHENTGGQLIPSLHPVISFLLPVAVQCLQRLYPDQPPRKHRTMMAQR